MFNIPSAVESSISLDNFVTARVGDTFALVNLPEEVVAVLFAMFSRSEFPLRYNLDLMVRSALEQREMYVRKVTTYVHDGIVARSNETSASLQRMAFQSHEHLLRQGGSVELPTDESTPGDILLQARKLVAGVLVYDIFQRAEGKAKEFHEKWVVGYGHASVAEHAIIHMGIENCTLLAAKVIEDGRLAAYTEKSTRYVDYRMVPVPDPERLGVPEQYREKFTQVLLDMQRRYAQMVDMTVERLKLSNPKAEGVPEKVWLKQLQTSAFDKCRGLLPMGLTTSLGGTWNSRHLAATLRKMDRHPLKEIRDRARDMREQASIVCPTLFKYSSDDGVRGPAEEKIRNLLATSGHRINVPRARGDASVRMDTPVVVDESIGDPRGDLYTLFCAIVTELTGKVFDHDIYYSWEEIRAVVREYLQAHTMHTQPGRALEVLSYTFDIITDIGAWRDIQRHRKISHVNFPVFEHGLGYYVPEELEDFPEHKAFYLDALEQSRLAWAQFMGEPWAQYVVPMASKVRVLLHANLREWFYTVERRSEKQGHIVYRRIAMQVADCIKRALPLLGEEGMWAVDYAEYQHARTGK